MERRQTGTEKEIQLKAPNGSGFRLMAIVAACNFCLINAIDILSKRNLSNSQLCVCLFVCWSIGRLFIWLLNAARHLNFAI